MKDHLIVGVRFNLYFGRVLCNNVERTLYRIITATTLYMV